MIDRGTGSPATERLLARGNQRSPPTLAVMERLSALLDWPQRHHSIVIVAGTNGKGSTVAALEAIARDRGMRVGAFVSPHLVHPAERIRIDGRPSSVRSFEALAAEVADPLDAVDGTTFEGLTAMAHLAFARAGVELAVMEVGLGGRFDPTNVCTPIVSVVTEIDLDHEAILGPGLERIAAEKAGVLRRGVPAWSSASGTAARVLEREAASVGAPLSFQDRDAAVHVGSVSPSGTVFTVPLPTSGVHTFATSLVGRHQARNAALAACVADAIGISVASIDSGLATVDWPGRMEMAHRGDGVTTWLDVAHNPAAVDAQVTTLADLAIRPALVVGVSDDKDLSAMARTWAGAVRSVRATRATTTPRAFPPATIQRAFVDHGHPVVTAVDDPVTAVLEARTEVAAGNGGGHVLVSGSAFLVGEIQAALAAGQLP